MKVRIWAAFNGDKHNNLYEFTMDKSASDDDVNLEVYKIMSVQLPLLLKIGWDADDEELI